jgi:two-component system capsular synthesis response regulator RcsB
MPKRFDGGDTMRRGNDDSSNGAGATQATQQDMRAQLAQAGDSRVGGVGPPSVCLDKPRAWRVALVDDHPFVRQAYEAIIGAEPDLAIVGSFNSSRNLTAAFRQTPVDIVLLDYRLADEDIDGVSLIQRLRAHFPVTRLLVCSVSDNAPTINASLLAGAHGFLSKAASLPECLTAIRAVAGGLRYVNGAIYPRESATTDALPAWVPPTASPLGLTIKEFDVLRCSLQGLSPSAIARKFRRSIKTVSGHKLSAYRKHGVETDPQLFLIRGDLDGL